MARVAIVIPTWNRAGLLAQALASLTGQTYPIDRVIVVDNGSTDDSGGVAARAGAEVISLAENAGFAVAVNRGLQEAAGAEWIGVLNNDVTLEPDWLARIMTKLEPGNSWFATGKLLDAQECERLEGSFDALCRGGCAWRCGHGRLDSPMWNQPRTIQLAPFTAVVFRAGLFERVGLMDERFESYLEDVDFGLRCAEAGLAGLYVPDAVAYHQGSATLGPWHPDMVRRISRNQLLLVAKHYPPNWVLNYGWPVFIAQTLWGFVALRHGALLSYFVGKVQGLRQFRQARRKRCASFSATGNFSSIGGFPAIISFPTIVSFSTILEQSEKEIREIQQFTGFDLYWRLYFALTRFTLT
jgi:GT2 family glycosyltransferase